MSIKTNSFTAFLDEKFIPLEQKVKIAIFVVVAILPLVIFYFLFFQPNSDQLDSLGRKEAKAQAAVDLAKKKASNEKMFEKEVELSRLEFEIKSALLPKEKEIPKLLKDISALGQNAGLEFISFKPLAVKPKDFYSEIPISIKIRGPYHNVGFFFDQVNKLERIVSVSNVKMASPKKEDGEMILTSNCQLLTYQFTNVELPKDDKKKKRK